MDKVIKTKSIKYILPKIHVKQRNFKVPLKLSTKQKKMHSDYKTKNLP